MAAIHSEWHPHSCKITVHVSKRPCYFPATVFLKKCMHIFLAEMQARQPIEMNVLPCLHKHGLQTHRDVNLDKGVVEVNNKKKSKHRYSPPCCSIHVQLQLSCPHFKAVSDYMINHQSILDLLAADGNHCQSLLYTSNAHRSGWERNRCDSGSQPHLES